VPTATSQAQGFIAVQLPAATLGDAPPTFTPTPEQVAKAAEQVILLPDPQSVEVGELVAVNGTAPERLEIPALKINAEIYPVGLVPVNEPAGAVAGGMPSDEEGVGWLTNSAPFGQAGNTVLTGHPQNGAAFDKLWTLEAGDRIILSAGRETQQYFVSEVLLRVEEKKELEGRVNNAELIKPTGDERLTLVTGGEAETQRTIIVARPGGNSGEN